MSHSFKEENDDTGQLARLKRIVEKLAKRADVPTPFCFISDNSICVNAASQHLPYFGSLIELTTATMNKLSDDELQALVGHELGHIQFHDFVRVVFPYYISFSLLSSSLYVVIWATILSFVLLDIDYFMTGILISLSLFVVSQIVFLIDCYNNRQREYRCDIFGAFICDNPRSAISMLKKIEATANWMYCLSDVDEPCEPLTKSEVIADMCLKISSLYDSHPPTSLRIKRLEDILGPEESPDIQE